MGRGKPEKPPRPRPEKNPKPKFNGMPLLPPGTAGEFPNVEDPRTSGDQEVLEKVVQIWINAGVPLPIYLVDRLLPGKLEAIKPIYVAKEYSESDLSKLKIQADAEYAALLAYQKNHPKK
jgi:hypothetical protein